MSEARKKVDIDEDLALLLEEIGEKSAISQKTGESGQDNILKLKKDDQYEAKNRVLSPYFYKVSNHHELFKIGSSYYEDFKKGVKSFAISSTGYQSSQQRTILGLASFFDHQESLRICIISDNLYLGAFKEIIQASQPSELDLKEGNGPIEVHSFYNHFDFIDMNSIVEVGTDKSVNYDHFLDELVEKFDVVFWDVPELYKIQSEKELFFPIVMRFESLSIIVAKSNTGQEELEEVRSFFMGYGINLKGLLLDSHKTEGDSSEVEKNGKSKSWWRKLFI